MVLQSALGHPLRARLPADARCRSTTAPIVRRRGAAALAVRPVRAGRRRRGDGARSPLLFTRTSLGLQMRAVRVRPRGVPPARRAGVAHASRRLDAVSRRRRPRGAAARADELGLNPHSTDSLFVYALHRRGRRRARLARRRAGRRPGRRRRDEPGDRLPRRGPWRRSPCSCCSSLVLLAAARRDSSRRRRRGAHEPAGRPRFPDSGRSCARSLVAARCWTVVALGGTFAARPVPQLPARARRRVPLRDGRAHACSSALTGQLSLGHAALMAVGGYGYALTANALGRCRRRRRRFVLALLAGALAAPRRRPAPRARRRAAVRAVPGGSHARRS